MQSELQSTVHTCTVKTVRSLRVPKILLSLNTTERLIALAPTLSKALNGVLSLTHREHFKTSELQLIFFQQNTCPLLSVLAFSNLVICMNVPPFLLMP